LALAAREPDSLDGRPGAAPHRVGRIMTEHDFIPSDLESASEDKRAALS
jgi:hypothetical protein